MRGRIEKEREEERREVRGGGRGSGRHCSRWLCCVKVDLHDVVVEVTWGGKDCIQKMSTVCLSWRS